MQTEREGDVKLFLALSCQWRCPFFPPFPFEMSFWLCNIARTSIGSSVRNSKRSSLRITAAMASTLQPAKK